MIYDLREFALWILPSSWLSRVRTRLRADVGYVDGRAPSGMAGHPRKSIFFIVQNFSRTPQNSAKSLISSVIIR